MDPAYISAKRYEVANTSEVVWKKKRDVIHSQKALKALEKEATRVMKTTRVEMKEGLNT